MSGSLARIANDEGMVFVMFDHVSPPAQFETASENMAEATTGSSRGASQLATDGSGTAGAHQRTTKLDEWELALDYREAMVELREECLHALEQRLSQLEETERQHGQGNVENKPSRKEREEAQKEAEEKTQDAIRALESADLSSLTSGRGSAGQMMRRSALRVLPHVAALFSLRLRHPRPTLPL